MKEAVGKWIHDWGPTLTSLAVIMGLVAWAVAPLSKAIDRLAEDRKEDRAAIVELKVAVAQLSAAVAGLRYRDVPDVSEKVEEVGDQQAATRVATDRNFIAMRTLTAKMDTLIRLEKRGRP